MHLVPETMGIVIADSKMCRAGHRVELVEVVRQNTAGKQALAQRHQRIGAIIDASQQDRLIEDRHPCRMEALGGSDHGIIDFIGVVGVDHHHALKTVISQPLQQARIDTLRQHNWQTSVDPQALELGHGGQVSDQRGQHAVIQTQRITATENDFVGGGIVAQTGHRRLPPGPTARYIAIGIMPPEAVTTVDRAGRRGHQQRAAVVLLQQARCALEFALGDWVRAKAWYRIAFGWLR